MLSSIQVRAQHSVQNRPRRVVTVAIGCFLALYAMVGTLPAFAQAPPTDRIARTETGTDGVSRAEILALVDATAQLASAYNLDGALAGRLALARAQVAAASEADLARFRDIAPQIRQLQDLLARADAILHSQNGPRRQRESPGFPEPVDPNYNWNFLVPGQDVDLDDGGDSGGANTDAQARNGNCSLTNRKTTQEMFALLNGTAIAEVVQQVASRICDQVIVVIGGGNASIVCVITDIIFDVVKAIQDNIFLCEDILDGAEATASFERLAHIHTDLENTGTTLATSIENARVDINTTVIQAAADQITAVNNAATLITEVVNTQSTNILNAVQANQDLFLRIEIEKALHSGKHYAALYLPQAKGGQLELVRQIVADAILEIQGTSDPVNGAPARLALAEAEYAAGRYKRAFTLYGEAYFEANKVLGEIR
jgi:hypothetical protein